MTQLKKITASLIKGPDEAPSANAQVWGIDLQKNLTSRVNYSYEDQTLWTPWMDGWNNAPSNLIDITACQQGENSGLAQVWALDGEGILHSCKQTAIGGLGKWSEWESSWQSAPKLTTICAVSQVGTDPSGSNRGAQIWGVDKCGVLQSTYQKPNTGPWQPWTSNWRNAPKHIKAMTACTQNNGKVILWALPENNILYAIEQTEPGGNWTPLWTPDWRHSRIIFTAIGAVQQDGDRGAQFWGIYGDGILTSIFEQSRGTDWTEWPQGSWSSSDPANLTEVAGCQNWDNGAVFLWALNNNGNVFFRQQTGPGEGWMDWEAWE